MLRLEGIISHQHIQDPPHDKSNYSSIFDCYGLVQVYFVTILIQVRHRHNTYRFFFPSWWVTVQLVKLMSLTDYSSVPLSFTHINNKKNQWITRPHNIQKSLNKTNISVCITTTSCLPPIWFSRHALLLTGCGFLRMTRAQYHAQESEYENTPPCIRGSGMLLSQLPLIHSQP